MFAVIILDINIADIHFHLSNFLLLFPANFSVLATLQNGFCGKLQVTISDIMLRY